MFNPLTPMPELTIIAEGSPQKEGKEGKENYPEFEIPDGFEALENMQDDDEDDFVCTVRKKKDGRAWLVFVEGVPVKSVATERAPKFEAPEGAEDEHSREKRYQGMFRKNLYSQ